LCDLAPATGSAKHADAWRIQLRNYPLTFVRQSIVVMMA
jgi:hypothetical protein